MSRYHVPGVAVGILHDGTVDVDGWGVTSVEHPLPVDADTLFQIASVTKTITATVIMRLVEQGKIRLDAPVRTYIPDFKVRDEAVLDGDFVDLGSMLSDDEEEGPPAKDTRMTVADEEPTGDEEQDFQDMLARFKQGIDENIDETDFQSHYDLGVAFKEMGLLDEAIAELQKALRAPEGKLRTSEMLGISFFEKGAYGVAESIRELEESLGEGK